jgi:hypothetical protein
MKGNTITTSVPTIAYQSTDNEAVITFTPATTLSELGGKIVLTGPKWYASQKRATYSYTS